MTVLDRLLQPPPRIGDCVLRPRNPLRASIARDLEMLLNTRKEEDLISPEYKESAVSILNFGVPELTRYGNLSSPIEQKKLCKSLEQSIEIFEPRLRKVSVRLMEAEKRSTMLRFRLEGTIDLSLELEVFEMGFKQDTGELSVLRGSGR